MPYRLLGSDATALLLGALLINAAALFAMAEVARRIGGVTIAVLLLLAGMLVAHASGSEFLRDPWVLPITVLPFGLFCVLAWAMTDGRIWSLPLAAIVLSFLVQTHIGYVAIAAPVFGLACVGLVVVARRAGPDRIRSLSRAALLTLGLLVVVWAAPIWDELFGYRNLTVLVDWFRAAPGAAHTLGEGLRIVLAQLAIPPDWLTGATHVGLVNGETTLGTSAPWPWLLLPFAWALWTTWRRRDHVATRLLVVLAATIAAGVLAVSRTIGFMYAYRFGWTLMLGALVTAATAWVAWRLLADRRPSDAAFVMPAVVIGLAVAAILTAIAATDTGTNLDAAAAETGRAAHRLIPHLRRDGGQVVLEQEGTAGGWSREGILLILERNGFDARVPADSGHAFGSHRARDRGAIQARLLVLVGSEMTGRVHRPGWKLVAYAGKRPLARELAYVAASERRLQRLTRALDRGDIGRDEFARRLRDLNERSSKAVAIVERAA